MMGKALTVVLDLGKTHTKLTAWSAAGELLQRETYANTPCVSANYPALDVEGIELWLGEALSRFAALGQICAIVPVGHGAAAAIVREGELAAPVMDYEFEPSPEMRQEYLRGRDAFAETGSPAMGMALNLGLQLHCIEQFHPNALSGNALILPWPQYWAWCLCGVAASEVTSWGSHTDLWSPSRKAPSAMALRRGWAQRFAPLRHASDVIGVLSKEWVERTGLKPSTRIHAGLHDSNAALVSARSCAQFAEGDATLISTGTWFVAMRSLGEGAAAPSLQEDRGCLFNVDVSGKPAPTALFMGGREIEMLGAVGIDAPERQSALAAALAAVLAAETMVLPTMASGTGAFPEAVGAWCAKPAVDEERDVAVALYAALMVDVGLDLIGSQGALLVEGRFAKCDMFTAALAVLRPRAPVYVAEGASDVSAGALRVVQPRVGAAASLRPVAPLALDLSRYRTLWRERVNARLP